MNWKIEFSEEYGNWLDSLSRKELRCITASLILLRDAGPGLGRPQVDTVQGSRHANMKELRTQCGGTPLRSFFAFDPRRRAIMLIGGDKTGDKLFYRRMIPLADRIFDRHLDGLKGSDE